MVDRASVTQATRFQRSQRSSDAHVVSRRVCVHTCWHCVRGRARDRAVVSQGWLPNPVKRCCRGSSAAASPATWANSIVSSPRRCETVQPVFKSNRPVAIDEIFSIDSVVDPGWKAWIVRIEFDLKSCVTGCLLLSCPSYVHPFQVN